MSDFLTVYKGNQELTVARQWISLLTPRVIIWHDGRTTSIDFDSYTEIRDWLTGDEE